MENKLRTLVNKSPFHETWWKHLIAGGASGSVSRSVTAPIDRLKVLAQVTGKSFRLIRGIKGLIEKDGFLSLWRGNGLNVVKITPEFAAKFMTYELVKLYRLEYGKRPITILDRFLAASMAGIVSQTVIYPLEVLKTRVVIQHGKETKRPRVVLAEIIATLGYTGLMRGYPSSMVGIVLFTGTDLCVYETLKILLRKKFNLSGITPPPVTVTCAICSCLFGQFVAYPLSMASTTVQVTDDLVTSARSIIAERYRRGGVLGLYRGASMSYVKAIPAVIITYLVYEQVLWKLGASMTT